MSQVRSMNKLRVVELLPDEQQGMARVVCDELRKVVCSTSPDIFLTRLLHLQDLADTWSLEKESSHPVEAAALAAPTNSSDSVIAENMEREEEPIDTVEDCDVSLCCENVLPGVNDSGVLAAKPRQHVAFRAFGRKRFSTSSFGKKRTMKIRVRCQICNKQFRYSACLDKHMWLAHSEGMQSQSVNRRTIMLDVLQLRLTPAMSDQANEMDSFQCTECDRAYATLAELCNHIRIHCIRSMKYGFCRAPTLDADVAEFQCEICERRFISAEELEQHLAENAAAHECPDCGRRIENVFYLRIHQLIHLDLKSLGASEKKPGQPVPCEICGQLMRSASGLHHHMASYHSQHKKYICHICAKEFTRRSQLTRHMLTHGGERRFECGKCGRRFLLGDMLRRHLRSVHAGMKPHLCSICGRPFAEKHQLNTHMKVHGPK